MLLKFKMKLLSDRIGKTNLHCNISLYVFMKSISEVAIDCPLTVSLLTGAGVRARETF